MMALITVNQDIQRVHTARRKGLPILAFYILILVCGLRVMNSARKSDHSRIISYISNHDRHEKARTGPISRSMRVSGNIIESELHDFPGQYAKCVRIYKAD